MRGLLRAGAFWLFSAAVTVAVAEPVTLEPYVPGRDMGLLVATVAIDGRPARLLFDTGAGVTLVTPQFAPMIACTPYGALSGFRMRGERLSFQKCGSRVVEAGGRRAVRDIGAFDLLGLLGEGAPPIDGIVGLDAFDGRVVTLSLAEQRLYLDERPGRGWSEGAVRFQREVGGAGLSMFVRVQAQTGELWMLLDSGSVGTEAYLSPGALSQLGDPEADAPITLTVSGAGSQQVHAQVVETLIYDGVLGERFMRRFDIAVDIPRGRIWWRPRS